MLKIQKENSVFYRDRIQSLIMISKLISIPIMHRNLFPKWKYSGFSLEILWIFILDRSRYIPFSVHTQVHFPDNSPVEPVFRDIIQTGQLLSPEYSHFWIRFSRHIISIFARRVFTVEYLRFP